MSDRLDARIRLGRHLPDFMRDFHAQKDVFKTIGGVPRSDTGIPAEITWVSGHIYVVDRFLPAMAGWGYTLQRWRANVTFDSLVADIESRREGEAEQLRSFLSSQKDGAA